MKFLIFAAILVVALVSAEEKERSYGGSSYSKPAAPSYSAPAAPSYSAPAPAAPAYAPSSYSAPPCPQNYLFSCGASVQPVGCSAPSYGSSGAYSTNYPTYAAAPQGNLMGAYSTNYASYAPAPQYFY